MIPILACVVTYNPFATGRVDLLEQTVESMREAFPTSQRVLFTNGLTDGSEEHLRSLLRPGEMLLLFDHQGDGQHTPGHGRYSLITEALKLSTWLALVMSDDDMVWRKGAERRISTIWEDATWGLEIVSGLLEPEWSWNTPRETVICGDEPVLIRDSCPGAGWTMPRWVAGKRHEQIARQFGYDYEMCKLIRGDNGKVGQVDLAEHIGWQRSTHGNDADRSVAQRPLDKGRWGLR